MGHALIENRHGLVVDSCLTQATGHAERIAAFSVRNDRFQPSRPSGVHEHTYGLSHGRRLARYGTLVDQPIRSEH